VVDEFLGDVAFVGGAHLAARAHLQELQGDVAVVHGDAPLGPATDLSATRVKPLPGPAAASSRAASMC
jgi:hypothetical protein